MARPGVANLLSAILFLFFVKDSIEVVHPDGVSKVSRYQDDLGTYDFGYTVSSKDGEHFHNSGKDTLGRVVGSYGLTANDGRQRIVDYVADHNGFRAHIRSNEPGLASSLSDDVTVVKTGEVNADPFGQNLDFAASSNSRTSFGDRIRETSSSVTYARPGEEVEHHNNRRRLSQQGTRDNIASSDGVRGQERKITQQDNADPSPNESDNLPENAEPRFAIDNAPVYRGYQPPLDPFSGNRQQVISSPRQTSRRYPARQPTTPAYGGIETRNPLLDPIVYGRHPSINRHEVTRRPVVTVSSIHGGIGDMPYLLNPTAREAHISRPGYDSRSHGFRETNYGPRNPGINTRPGNIRNPNLVLRAIAIPNGIQAVQVDPATGEIFNTPEFPAYDPNNRGFGQYDDDEDRPYGGNNQRDYEFGEYGQHGVQNPYSPSHRETLPSGRNRSSYPYDYENNRHHPQSETSPDTNLNKPSSRDLEEITRILERVNSRHHGIHPVDNSIRPPLSHDDHRGHAVRPPLKPREGNFPGFSQQPNSRYPPNFATPLRSHSYDSNVDYSKEVPQPTNGGYDYPNYRYFNSQQDPRDLSPLFPLTFGRGFSEPAFPPFNNPIYNSNRGYRSIDGRNIASPGRGPLQLLPSEILNILISPREMKSVDNKEGTTAASSDTTVSPTTESSS